jgi:hypothetical protein
MDRLKMDNLKSRPDLTAGQVKSQANEGGQWYLMKVSDWSAIYS